MINLFGPFLTNVTTGIYEFMNKSELENYLKPLIVDSLINESLYNDSVTSNTFILDLTNMKLKYIDKYGNDSFIEAINTVLCDKYMVSDKYYGCITLELSDGKEKMYFDLGQNLIVSDIEQSAENLINSVSNAYLDTVELVYSRKDIILNLSERLEDIGSMSMFEFISILIVVGYNPRYFIEMIANGNLVNVQKNCTMNKNDTPTSKEVSKAFNHLKMLFDNIDSKKVGTYLDRTSMLDKRLQYNAAELKAKILKIQIGCILETEIMALCDRMLKAIEYTSYTLRLFGEFVIFRTDTYVGISKEEIVNRTISGMKKDYAKIKKNFIQSKKYTELLSNVNSVVNLIHIPLTQLIWFYLMEYNVPHMSKYNRDFYIADFILFMEAISKIRFNEDEETDEEIIESM